MIARNDQCSRPFPVILRDLRSGQFTSHQVNKPAPRINSAVSNIAKLRHF